MSRVIDLIPAYSLSHTMGMAQFRAGKRTDESVTGSRPVACFGILSPIQTASPISQFM
jgi:hypothetical protein